MECLYPAERLRDVSAFNAGHVYRSYTLFICLWFVWMSLSSSYVLVWGWKGRAGGEISMLWHRYSPSATGSLWQLYLHAIGTDLTLCRCGYADLDDRIRTAVGEVSKETARQCTESRLSLFDGIRSDKEGETAFSTLPSSFFADF